MEKECVVWERGISGQPDHIAMIFHEDCWDMAFEYASEIGGYVTFREKAVRRWHIWQTVPSNN